MNKLLIFKNLPVLLLCISSPLYIYQFFPAPFYFFFIVSLVLLLFSNYRYEYKLDVFEWITFISIFISMFAFRIIDSNYSVMSYYIIGFICFYSIVAQLKTKSNSEKLLCGWVSLISTTFVISIDTVARFLTPNLDYIENVTVNRKEDLVFYAYKHSYVFQDSNFTALASIMMVCLSLVLWVQYKRKFAFCFFIVNSILVVFSFSRSAIAVMLVLYIFVLIRYLHLKFSKSIYISLSLSIFSLLLLLPVIYVTQSSLEVSDGSLLTKFQIFNEAYIIIQRLSLFDILYGWGFNQSMYHMERSAHNLLITLLLETGVIGLFVFCIFISRYLVKNIWCFLTFSTFLMVSMSFGFIISAYMVPLALVVSISEGNNE